MNTQLIFKSVAIIFIALFFPSAMYAQTHFSGFAGAAGNLGSSQEPNAPQVTIDGVFFGQLDLFGKVYLRTGVTIHTEDLFSGEMFQNVPALFTLDEFSVTLRFPHTHVTHYISPFMGEFESVGSDIFLQRHFGIQPISSRISETWLGIRNSAIYPFSGMGLAYTAKLRTPQAFGAWVYVNEKIGQKYVNADFRFGGVFSIVSLDFSFGAGFPLLLGGGNSGTSNQQIQLHTGTTILIGNRHNATLFLQAGITKIGLSPPKDEGPINLSDIYFLIEPRFKTDFINIHFTLFNLPKETVSDLFFISNTIGANLAIFVENIHAGFFRFTIGSHLTVSAYDSTLDKFNEITPQKLSFQLSPFIETPLFRGTLMSRFTIDFMKIAEAHKNIKFSLGYKVSL